MTDPQIAIQATNVDAPEGPINVSLTAEGPVVLEGERGFSFGLGQGERGIREVGLRATGTGVANFTLRTLMADGSQLSRSFSMPVRSIARDDVRMSSITLTPGRELTLGSDLLEGFAPGTAVATLTVSSGAGFDVGGVVRALADYPYRCTEQQTSRAFPLVALPRDVVAAALPERSQDVATRVNEAVAGILANQSSSGSFGLWGPGSTNLWLDAYATDFLTRARDAGYDVAETPLRSALDNLANGLGYAGIGDDLDGPAYAAYVLARAGRASIGDLRYRAANVRGIDRNTQGATATPLALAHLAGALSLYGERERALELMREAVSRSKGAHEVERYASFGSDLRDDAAIIAVALDSGLEGAPWRDLVEEVAAGRRAERYTSTQEDAWSLLAAAALMRGDPPRLTVDGSDHDGTLLRTLDAEALSRGLALGNRADAPVSAVITVRGRPLVTPPARADGYRITRDYRTLDGKPVDLATVERGQRLAVVIEVAPQNDDAARVLVEDPLPAGFVIDNPNLLRSGDVSALGLDLSTEVEHQEFRADRFMAAFERKKGDRELRRFAYLVRATNAGTFEHPAATVESMYSPEERGRTETGRVTIR